MNYFILGVFILTYIFLISGKVNKLWIVGVSSGLLIFTRTISLDQAFSFINWNVLSIFVGMLILADMFIDSRVPAYLARNLASKAKTTALAFIFICALTSIISAFVENVATVLIIAPIAITLARHLRIRVTPFLIGIAICSNLQGTATLVGDPPSMILAGYAKMTFNDFFWFNGSPGIFFAVQVGAIVSIFVLYYIFRKHTRGVGELEKVNVKSWIPTWLIFLLIVALAFASIFGQEYHYLTGIITLIFALIGIIWKLLKEGHHSIPGLLKPLDWNTTFFLFCIFIIVGSLGPGGIIDALTDFMKNLTGDNIFYTYSLILWFSVIASAVIDNVPYILMMLPVTAGLAAHIGVAPYLFYFALLLGASVGGNITPIGASANIVAVGMAKKKAGEIITFWQFVKIGLPFTISAIAASWLFGWIFWQNLV